MYGVPVTQDSLAKWSMKMNRRGNTLYEEPGSVSRLLAEFGNIGTVYEPKPLSYEFIKSEIEAKRPIIISVLQRPNYHTQIIYGVQDSILLLLDPAYGYMKQEYKLYEIVCDHNLILRSNPTLSDKAYEFYNSTIQGIEFVGYTPKAHISIYDACYKRLAMQKLMPGGYKIIISDSGKMIYKELEVK